MEHTGFVFATWDTCGSPLTVIVKEPVTDWPWAVTVHVPPAMLWFGWRVEHPAYPIGPENTPE